MASAPGRAWRDGRHLLGAQQDQLDAASAGGSNALGKGKAFGVRV